MSDHILVEQDGAIATVVFNRPKMRNAISLDMWAEIAMATERLSKDDSVRAVVYRGAGKEAFASGADISEFQEHRRDTQTALAYGKQTDAAYTAIRLCPKPTVAMIFGFCMGGAMAIAMGCDLRFAAGGSKFGIPAPGGAAHRPDPAAPARLGARGLHLRLPAHRGGQRALVGARHQGPGPGHLRGHHGATPREAAGARPGDIRQRGL